MFKLKSLVSLVICASLLISLSGFAFAEHSEEYYTLVSPYYDPTISSCSATGSAANATGSDVKSTTWNFLVSKGLSAEQVAGIMGNLAHESGSYDLKTNAIEGGGGGGYGLAQWTGGRRTALVNYAAGQGRDPSDLGLQLDYLWHELTTSERASLAAIKRQTTVDEATKSFMLEFERPGIKALESRIKYANQYFTEFQGQVAPDSSCAAGSTAGKYGWDLEGPTKMVYYSQTDPKWADKPYGSSTISSGGCGPTSVAMVIATLIDKSVTPDLIAKTYSSYYTPGSGSSWSLFTDAPKNYGLTTLNIGVDFASAKRTLENGGLVIVSVNEGTFTSSGHIMVIRKVSEDGNTFYLADPISKDGKTNGESNTKGYTVQELMTSGALKNMWGVSK